MTNASDIFMFDPSPCHVYESGTAPAISNMYTIAEVPEYVLIDDLHPAIGVVLNRIGHASGAYGIVSGVDVDVDASAIHIWDLNIAGVQHAWLPAVITYAEFIALVRSPNASHGAVLIADLLQQGWRLAHSWRALRPERWQN